MLMDRICQVLMVTQVHFLSEQPWEHCKLWAEHEELMQVFLEPLEPIGEPLQELTTATEVLAELVPREACAPDGPLVSLSADT